MRLIGVVFRWTQWEFTQAKNDPRPFRKPGVVERKEYPDFRFNLARWRGTAPIQVVNQVDYVSNVDLAVAVGIAGIPGIRRVSALV